MLVKKEKKYVLMTFQRKLSGFLRIFVDKLVSIGFALGL